jgi:hypothetical protein
MHGPVNVKSPNNTSKWQMGFNSAFKGLSQLSRFIFGVKNVLFLCMKNFDFGGTECLHLICFIVEILD